MNTMPTLPLGTGLDGQSIVFDADGRRLSDHAPILSVFDLSPARQALQSLSELARSAGYTEGVASPRPFVVVDRRGPEVRLARSRGILCLLPASAVEQSPEHPTILAVADDLWVLYDGWTSTPFRPGR